MWKKVKSHRILKKIQENVADIVPKKNGTIVNIMEWSISSVVIVEEHNMFSGPGIIKIVLDVDGKT